MPNTLSIDHVLRQVYYPAMRSMLMVPLLIAVMLSAACGGGAEPNIEPTAETRVELDKASLATPFLTENEAKVLALAYFRGAEILKVSEGKHRNDAWTFRLIIRWFGMNVSQFCELELDEKTTIVTENTPCKACESEENCLDLFTK